METSLKQKIGIVLSFVGGVLIVGFNWAGGLVVLAGIAFVIFGLMLALRKEFKDESKWVHDSTRTDDE